MKRKNSAGSVVAVVLVGVALVLGLPRYLSYLDGDGLVVRSAGLVGKPVEAAIQAMGQPDRTYTSAEYRAVQPDIAASYNPDPPDIRADRVLEYGEGVRILLLFVDEGVVVQIYTGAT